MNVAQIEANLKQLIENITEHNFIFDLLLAYNTPKASVSRLQKGNLNLSKIPGEIVWKKKLFYKGAKVDDLQALVDNMSKDNRVQKHALRFVIATDLARLLAIDTKTNDKLDIAIKDLPRYYDFFLPLAGMEKNQHHNENPADVKAAERMAKLFDEIRRNNTIDTPEKVHCLNVFLSRLLFCYFAEDTGIFKDRVFTNSVSSHTQEDGSDVHTYLERFFEVLNTRKEDRKDLPAYLYEFEYVNGGLFRETHPVPIFTARARKLLIEIGELDWADINPDIFGSMMQAVVDPEERGNFGMHYTSVPNIMKVIEPLFLNELREEFEQGKYEPRKLNKLLDRIGRIKIFDPACGSGNFLIIAYKKLRELEIDILKQLQELSLIATGFEPKQLELIPKAQLTLAAGYKPTLFTNIRLTQFYGIELKDFAHELAILALWLAQHQMNTRFKEVFGAANATLPLTDAGNITLGNATRLDWEQVCPKEEGDEIYILGNPPYLGSSLQDEEQKKDKEAVFKSVLPKFKDLDYIACWFYKGATFIQNTKAKISLVSTNSICQGEQVALLWPSIKTLGIEIDFAYQSFRWKNNAKDNAGVTVVIIGLRNVSNSSKYIYTTEHRKVAANINHYLLDAPDIIIKGRTNTLSIPLPKMVYGNKLTDGGYLILSNTEKQEFIAEYGDSKRWIKRFVGTEDYLHGKERYCIDLSETPLDVYSASKKTLDRIEKVRSFRLKSKKSDTRELANRPTEFEFNSSKKTNAIIVPRTSSEKRRYIPMGFLSDENIISDSAQVIYTNHSWVFGILSSNIHMVWTHAVSGKLETRIRYSVSLTYNNFPFPEINQSQKENIELHVQKVLAEREKHSEKTLAQLYDPEKMPQGLRDAHNQLDLAVERCYRSKPFESDEERLEYLFKLYEKMIAEEQAKGTLYETKKMKTSKTKV